MSTGLGFSCVRGAILPAQLLGIGNTFHLSLHVISWMMHIFPTGSLSQQSHEVGRGRPERFLAMSDATAAHSLAQLLLRRTVARKIAEPCLRTLA